MPLNNLADHLKTTPTTAPPSLGAVRNQLRFWGMGNSSGSGRALPDLQARMGRYKLDSVQQLAQLQRRASELQIGAERAVQATQAGVIEDQSNLANKQLDLNVKSQEEDLLGLASRATAGLIGIGRAARGVASAAGLKGMQNFLEKMPLLGKSRKTRETEALKAKIMDAFEGGKIDRIARLNEELNMKMDLIVSAGKLKTSVAGKFPDDEIDDILGTSELEDEYEKANKELTRLIYEAADPFGVSRNAAFIGFGR